MTELAAAEAPQQVQQQLLQQQSAAIEAEEGMQNAQQNGGEAGRGSASMPLLDEASLSPLFESLPQHNLQGRNRLEPAAAGSGICTWADGSQVSNTAPPQASRLPFDNHLLFGSQACQLFLLVA